jgi:hypothetical protein
MTATTVPTTRAARAIDTIRPLWLVGLVVGLVGSAAAIVVALAAEALDVPMLVAESETADTMQVPASGFVIFVMASTAVGVVLAYALARWAKHPARTFVVVGVVLTALSMGLPITTHQATTATRLVLGLTHVVAAAIIIPAIAHQLALRRSIR